MNKLRYQPLSLLNELQNEMNSLFSRGNNGDLSTAATSAWTPAVDIKEEKDRYVIIADIPGVDPKDIELHMEGGVLTIQGHKETESKTTEEDYSRIERFSGSFYRRFALPDMADGDNISAKSKNGVLEVTIPKMQKSKPKKIQVES